MDLQLRNKRAIVTGSTAGIGFATAIALAKEGAAVVVNGRTQQRVDAAVARVRELAGRGGGDVAAAPGELAYARHGRVNALLRPAVDDDGRAFLR